MGRGGGWQMRQEPICDGVSARPDVAGVPSRARPACPPNGRHPMPSTALVPDSRTAPAAAGQRRSRRRYTALTFQLSLASVYLLRCVSEFVSVSAPYTVDPR
jgi:hypothetical protein